MTAQALTDRDLHLPDRRRGARLLRELFQRSLPGLDPEPGLNAQPNDQTRDEEAEDSGDPRLAVQDPADHGRRRDRSEAAQRTGAHHTPGTHAGGVDLGRVGVDEGVDAADADQHDPPAISRAGHVWRLPVAASTVASTAPTSAIA